VSRRYSPIRTRYAADTERSIFVLRQYEPLPRPLVSGQARELLAYLAPPYDLMARWQLYTGLRISELLRLGVDDINGRPTPLTAHHTIEITRKGRKPGYVIAPASLLDSYSEERVYAADENLMNSTRSTDFITPKSRASRTFRNAILSLAKDHAFGRSLVNSGRLSVPSFLVDSSLNTADADSFAGRMLPGAPLDDAPIEKGGAPSWLLQSTGNRFQLMVFVDDPATVDFAVLSALDCDGIRVEPLIVSRRAGSADSLSCLHDVRGVAFQRYDARPGTAYLIRPDQHVAARWRTLDTAQGRAAVARACGRS
jgi:hypothetical protein